MRILITIGMSLFLLLPLVSQATDSIPNQQASNSGYILEKPKAQASLENSPKQSEASSLPLQNPDNEMYY